MTRNYTYLLLFISFVLNSCSKQEPRPTPKSAFAWGNVGEGIVQFTDQSSEADTYSWDFGDGSSSNDKNPKHTFPNNAKYTITLTISNPSGSDKASKQIEVSSFSSPIPNFTITQGEDGQVSFKNLSTNTDRYLWSFGNNKTSTEKEPSLKYEENKKYTVFLTSYGKGGEVKIEKELEVTSIKPIVDFTYTISNGEVTFVNKTKNAESYSWNFGNGLVSSDANPIARYTRTGTYTVTLLAKGKAGQGIKTASVLIYSVNLSLSDIVDNQSWVDYLPGTWGVFINGEGNKFDNYTYNFTKSSNTLIYKNYYSPYVYLSLSPETTTLVYKYSIVDNVIYTDENSGKRSKLARLQVVSDDEMKLFRIIETSSSYTETAPLLLTKVSNEEKSSASVVKSTAILSTLTGVWDQGTYSIYKNVFFDFSADKNYYNYNYTLDESRNIRKTEFKIDENNIMSYRTWNSTVDPSWRKYKLELTNNSTLKLYSINSNGSVSSTADYVLRKR